MLVAMSIISSILPFFLIMIMFNFYSLGKQNKSMKQMLKQNNYLLKEIGKKVGVEEKFDPNQQKIVSLVEQGKKIEAIKLAREIHRMGLKEAKEYVEDLEEKKWGY